MNSTDPITPLTQDELTALQARYYTMTASINALNTQHAQHAQLICVSKTKPAAMIAQLYQLGQRDFGENYLQEALAKIRELGDLAIRWHYIGHIQRNKTRDIATHFDWVHTLERDIIATRLNEQRPSQLPPLNVLIQLNIDDEPTKSGCQPEALDGLIEAVLGCERLVLRGLMVIPAQDSDSAFERTRTIFEDVKARFDLPQWDTLSMGMSGDMAAAIATGSTMVRIGSAIFGARI